MADRISVSTQLLEQSAHELDGLKTVIDDVSGILTGIDTSKGSGGDLKVSIGGLSGSTAAEVTRSLRKAMSNGGKDIGDIASAVRKSVQIFERAEERNRQIALGNVKSTSSYSGNKGSNGSATSSIPHAGPFDDERQFGGDQAQPFRDVYCNNDTARAEERRERYKQIIERNTHHQLTDEELKDYLARMNSEGCSYMAVVNSILSAFKDDPEGFEEAFGFEMYKDGELNYNELFVDLYSSWDNKNTSGEFNERQDFNLFEDGNPFTYDYWSDETGKGPKIGWWEDVAVQYLRDHGVNATAELHEYTRLTPEMYDEMVSSGKVKQGEVIINVTSGFGGVTHLFDENGDKAVYKDIDGIVKEYSFKDHAMTVTGTKRTKEGEMLEVSSWGKKYYIKMEDIANSGLLDIVGYMTLKIE